MVYIHIKKEKQTHKTWIILIRRCRTYIKNFQALYAILFNNTSQFIAFLFPVPAYLTQMFRQVFLIQQITHI
jgi:hypothetical protein